MNLWQRVKEIRFEPSTADPEPKQERPSLGIRLVGNAKSLTLSNPTECADKERRTGVKVRGAHALGRGGSSVCKPMDAHWPWARDPKSAGRRAPSVLSGQRELVPSVRAGGGCYGENR